MKHQKVSTCVIFVIALPLQIEDAVRTQTNKLFQLIGAAHEVLSNPTTRARLDLDLQIDDNLYTGSSTGRTNYTSQSTFPNAFRQAVILDSSFPESIVIIKGNSKVGQR